MLITLLLAAIPGAIFLLWWFYSPLKEPPTKGTPLFPRTFHTPAACARILACTGYSESVDQNTLTKVESRAHPNQRLVRAFLIDNAFTTTDDGYRKRFRAHAASKIKLSDANWKRVAELAQQLIGTTLVGHDGKNQLGIRLDNLVQSISLKISLHVLFHPDSLELDDEAVLEIASSINHLWVGSKRSNNPADEEKQRLRNALATIFPHLGSSARENPLNLILPAYETMWRIVLFCFIEVAFHQGAKPGWATLLTHYLADPTKARFEQRGTSTPNAVSAADIVNEALRLYPPTKRVYRQLHMSGKSEPELVAADIEACHRIPAIWGDDVRTFRPSRWSEVGNDAREAFMPFGGSTFVCTAKQDFGPRMVGVLVAALAARIEAGEWKLEVGAAGSDRGQELSGREPLVSERMGYEWMMISRRGS
ncbi:hypothetical protein MMC28_008696 [Mycoblastus sanguinarius]|nr:hypothetical protein [Mycoblastus sanguinarius]